MTMADLFAVLSGLIIIGLGFPAILITLKLSFPQAVERASLQVGTKPKRSLFRGFLAFLLFFVLAAFLGKALIGPFKLLSLITLLIGLSLTMLGGAGLISQLAERFRKLSSSEHPILELFCSALLIELAAALPLVGWFVVLPATFLLMLGAGCEAVFFSHRVQREEIVSANSVSSVV